MTASPDLVLWEEVCIITGHCLHLHKVAIQLQGRAMWLMVLQERARWLNLTTLMTKEREDLIDTPISAQGLFGEAVTLMQKRCEERKKSVAQLPFTFRIPKLPKPQASPRLR